MAEQKRMVGPDGNTYNVTFLPGETEQQARARFESRFTFDDPVPTDRPNIPAGYTQIKIGGEEYKPREGIIYISPPTQEFPQGKKFYVDPVYSTSDQEEVEAINQGLDAGSMYRQRELESVVEMNPVTTRAQTASRAVPFIGEYIDELADPEQRAQIRLGRTAMEETRPLESMGLQAATGLLTSGAGYAALPRMAQRPVTNILAKTALGSGLAATEGAISGYGAGETPEERERFAKFGAAIGGGAGGFGSAVGAFLEPGLARRLASVDVRALARELNIDVDAARILRDQALSAESPEELLRNMNRYGADARVIDASRQASELLDITRLKGGAAQRTAQEGMRDLGRTRGRRFVEAMDRIFNPPAVESAEELLQQINSRTAPQRREAYENVYNTVIDYGTDEGKKILRVLDSIPDSLKRNAIERANIAIAAADDLQAPPIAYREIAGADGNTVIELMGEATPIHLDYIKRALQQISLDPDKRGTPFAADLNALARKLTSSISEAIPGYRRALSLGLDTIQEREAVRIAQDLTSDKISVSTIRQFLDPKNLSRPQLDLLRQTLQGMVGFEIQRLRKLVRPTMGDMMPDEESMRAAVNAIKKYATPEVMDKLRAILGPEGMGDFRSQVEKLAATAQRQLDLATNSKTEARRQMTEMAEEAMSPAFLRSLTELRGGDAVRSVQRYLGGGFGEMQGQEFMEVMDQVADVLINRRGAEARFVVDQINKLRQNQPIQDEAARRVAEVVTALAPALTYSSAEAVSR